ncbi:hypothetical protein AVEN_1142-1 [Araneus ventricosus]|uniref:Retrotransposon gag domain-containing protein n=1 Tax=Araneus ventricosus TaxID=182803 RepID=A0A4Y2NN99_ARAVE|nr:hypothetical protein AVEN_1142-1 [Araneus ventricosus]
MALPQSLPMEPFNAEVETFTSYLDRLEMFFTTNNVPDDKKVPTMITLLSAKTYALLRNLVEPVKPEDKSFQELIAILAKQLNPKPLVILERFRFHQWNQTEGKSMAEFCAQLKKLATNCEFGQFLNDSLRERFVCGLRSEAIQKTCSYRCKNKEMGNLSR